MAVWVAQRWRREGWVRLTHDVFVSYPVADKPTADALVATLENRGVRCWVAPRDVIPGVQWADAIVHAVAASRLMVLVFSSHTNASHHVVRELNQAAQHGLPIVPLRVEDALPSAALEYYVASTHWLDAVDPPLEAHLDHLATVVRGLLDTTPTSEPAEGEVVHEAMRLLEAAPIAEPAEDVTERSQEDPLLPPKPITVLPTQTRVGAATGTIAPSTVIASTTPLVSSLPAPPPLGTDRVVHLERAGSPAPPASARRRWSLLAGILAVTLLALAALAAPRWLSGGDEAPSASPSPAAGIGAPAPTGPTEATGGTGATEGEVETVSVHAPMALHTGLVGAYEVRLTWDRAPHGVGVDRFLVFRDDERIASVEEAAFTDSTVEPAHTFVYRVVAVGVDGSRASSKELSVTTDQPPTAPSVTTGGGGGGTQPQPSPTCSMTDWLDGKC